MQELLEFVLKNIVTIPDDVKITLQEEEGSTHYLITLNPEDIGRVIGKEGKVIKAIRTIMRVIAIQRGVHIRISVVSGDQPSGDQEFTSQVEDQSSQTEIENGNITVEV